MAKEKNLLGNKNCLPPSIRNSKWQIKNKLESKNIGTFNKNRGTFAFVSKASSTRNLEITNQAKESKESTGNKDRPFQAQRSKLEIN